MKTILMILISFNLYAQSIISFDQGWNPNQAICPDFTIANLLFHSSHNFVTNYGYMFDTNSNSLFYYFDGTKDSIVISSWQNQPLNFYSLSLYQVSQSGVDTLLVDGWNGNIKKYSTVFLNMSSWKTVIINFLCVDKMIIRSGNTVLSHPFDYNFDNISFEYRSDVNGDGLVDLSDLIITDNANLKYLTTREK
jgi:hypothetical protein